jgi:hypothetical protein
LNKEEQVVKIKRHDNGKVIYSGNFISVERCLQAGYVNKVCFDYAYLGGINLTYAPLDNISLNHAYLNDARLAYTGLRFASLKYATLRYASLYNAIMRYTCLDNADMQGANLTNAVLTGASLNGTTGLVKRVGVEIGNYYWKRFNPGLINNGYQFFVGLNTLRKGKVFANDQRESCTYPGFHFASRSWCKEYYPYRPLEAKIRIPEGATINEPWGSDGKASADMIEIIQVFDTQTGEDVTNRYRR